MASSPLLLLILCSLAVTQANVSVFNLRATDLPADIFGISDGYVKVFCDSASLGMTSTQHNEINPWWTEQFAYKHAQENSVLRLEVHDSDLVFDELLGICQCQLKQGYHDVRCSLEKGGTLYYSYTLS